MATEVLNVYSTNKSISFDSNVLLKVASEEKKAAMTAQSASEQVNKANQKLRKTNQHVLQLGVRYRLLIGY